MSNVSKQTISGKVGIVPTLRFEDQSLTSFAGLVVFQKLFNQLDLKQQLYHCFSHLPRRRYGHHTVILLLIVHLLLGYRDLRDCRYYRDDEMVRRLLGLKRLPEVSTMSRSLASADNLSVDRLRRLNRKLVLEHLDIFCAARLTLDFDGTVVGTGRHAEGAAIGFNKQKKGQRSYYPLFCTVAQTAQVFDLHHRPGNVHDMNGAKTFINSCLTTIARSLPSARLETRMDSAFYSKDIIDMLDAAGVEFTTSVPFTRYPVLKNKVESRRRWRKIDAELSYFEDDWKPDSWNCRYRFLFIRRQVNIKRRTPLQLDLFEPRDQGYEYKVIVTNKRLRPGTVVAFHEGRGAQEAVFGELKSQCQMDHVPVTTRVGNQLFMGAAILVHNLTRQLQMQADRPVRKTTAKRSALWTFKQVNTLRRNIIQRAGRLVRPQGKLVLSMSRNPAVEQEILHYLSVA